ncbi:MAG: hypothetical protein ACTSQP_20820 [Promethearchaeota archaeon]
MNTEILDERNISNSIVPRKKSSHKIPKKRQNQRKCIEGILEILDKCFCLE